MNKITLTTSISVEDLIHSLLNASSNWDETAKIIARIDEGMQDWDFTIRLIAHFKALEIEYVNEGGGVGKKVDFITPKKIKI